MEQHEEVRALRQCMEHFLEERCAKKLAQNKGASETKLDEIRESYRRETWLARKARSAAKIQVVTHCVKFIHSQIEKKEKDDISEYHDTLETILPEGLVGTPSLSNCHPDFSSNNNAENMPLFGFFQIEVNGKTILQRIKDNDKNLLKAFSDNAELAESWMTAFRCMWEGSRRPASHTLAKQVYFPLEGGGYHLLAPLFPTSLVQRVYETMREDRFGVKAKEAREAHRAQRFCTHGYGDYPRLLVRRFGGTKPQNISQLNSERHGESWLLASLPPLRDTERVRLPLGVKTVFGAPLNALPDVARARLRLVGFLERAAGEYTNIRIRDTRAALLDDLLTAVVQWAARIRAEEPGWSADAACRLPEAERFWLDPRRGESDPEWRERRDATPWRDALLETAAVWCNDSLKTRKLPMSDDEHHLWKREIAEALRQLEEGETA